MIEHLKLWNGSSSDTFGPLKCSAIQLFIFYFSATFLHKLCSPWFSYLKNCWPDLKFWMNLKDRCWKNVFPQGEMQKKVALFQHKGHPQDWDECESLLPLPSVMHLLNPLTQSKVDIVSLNVINAKTDRLSDYGRVNTMGNRQVNGVEAIIRLT